MKLLPRDKSLSKTILKPRRVLIQIPFLSWKILCIQIFLYLCIQICFISFVASLQLGACKVKDCGNGYQVATNSSAICTASPNACGVEIQSCYKLCDDGNNACSLLFYCRIGSDKEGIVNHSKLNEEVHDVLICAVDMPARLSAPLFRTRFLGQPYKICLPETRD